MILAPTLSINGSYGLATVEYNAVVVSGAGSTEINGTYTMTGRITVNHTTIKVDFPFSINLQ
jgi:hypothetical protein